MALLTILNYPDQRLHTIAKPVKEFNAVLKRLVNDMRDTMYQAPGIGLAATQVDQHIQLIVIDTSKEQNNLLVFINPKIIAANGTQDYEEGCLSVPGVYETVTRAEKITVQAQDIDGKTFTLEAEGLLSVCIQHEMDHLLGKVFVEYLSPLKRNRIKTKMLKHNREISRTHTKSAKSSMKIIFAGTPEFAVPALAKLLQAGHDIVMVLTQPDRPAGRGMQLKASPVKQLALQHNISVFQPESLKPAEAQAYIAAVNADVMIVAAYGLIIPTAILNMPLKGCYNIHASLLPRWRGAAPIHRSILAGDAETGVTIMEVVPALDAGAMVSKGVLPILPTDTTQTLHDALANLGADLMVQAIADLSKNGKLTSTPQDESLVTYAHKLEKTESAIDWHKASEQLSRQIRAFNPFPVATAQFRGETCRIWFAMDKQSQASSGQTKAGEIVAVNTNICVACEQGVLEIFELQMPGGKRQSAQQFIQGHHVKVGDLFT